MFIAFFKRRTRLTINELRDYIYNLFQGILANFKEFKDRVSIFRVVYDYNCIVIFNKRGPLLSLWVKFIITILFKNTCITDVVISYTSGVVAFCDVFTLQLWRCSPTGTRS